MKSLEQWMDEYSDSHQHPYNQKMHKICVPIIMFSVLGILWSIPTPDFFVFLPFVNWATLVSSLALIFYLTLSFRMFLGMLLQVIIMLWLCFVLRKIHLLLPISLVSFILAWIGQFKGHKIEGKKPSFLTDVVFLLIGPLWLTRWLYQKIGIRI